jgi:hypothetical protein
MVPITVLTTSVNRVQYSCAFLQADKIYDKEELEQLLLLYIWIGLVHLCLQKFEISRGQQISIAVFI